MGYENEVSSRDIGIRGKIAERSTKCGEIYDANGGDGVAGSQGGMVSRKFRSTFIIALLPSAMAH